MAAQNKADARLEMSCHSPKRLCVWPRSLINSECRIAQTGRSAIAVGLVVQSTMTVSEKVIRRGVAAVIRVSTNAHRWNGRKT